MEAGEIGAECEACRTAAPKYTCPACHARTCSLPCVQAHKRATGCTGKRPRTTALPLGQMDDASITEDARLLADAARLAGRALDSDKAGRPFHWMLLERRLLVKTLPAQFSRHQANRSRWHRAPDGSRSVTWTADIRRAGTTATTRIHEDDPLDQHVRLATGEALFVLNEARGCQAKAVPPGATLRQALVDMAIIEYPVLVVK